MIELLRMPKQSNRQLLIQLAGLVAASALTWLLAVLLSGYACYSGLVIWHYSARLDEQTVQQFLAEQPLPARPFSWVYADEYLPT